MSCRVPTVRSMCSISIDVSPRICCRHDDVDPRRQPRGEPPALLRVLPSVRSMMPGLAAGGRRGSGASRARHTWLVVVCPNQFPLVKSV